MLPIELDIDAYSAASSYTVLQGEANVGDSRKLSQARTMPFSRSLRESDSYADRIAI